MIFFGGLGRVSEGFRMWPDLEGVLNRHPYPFMAHGCLLEGMILGLAAADRLRSARAADSSKPRFPRFALRAAFAAQSWSDCALEA